MRSELCKNTAMVARLTLLLLAAASTAANASPTLLFVTDPSATNDVLVAAGKGGVPTKTFATVAAALTSAKPDDGLLIMADGMLPADPGAPAGNANATIVVQDAEWAAIKAKRLKVYLEFPRSAPPAAGDDGAAAVPLPMGQTLWERAAVSATGGLGEELPYLALLHPCAT
jgi:hypothetical protein